MALRPPRFMRADVRELYPPGSEAPPAAPPTHKAGTPVDLYGDRPGQRKQRGRQPLPPRVERAPDLVALERGHLLYGQRADERGQVRVARLLEGDTGTRLEATFAIATIIVQNTAAAATILVAVGEADPVLASAVAIVPPGRLVSVPVAGERVVRAATADGSPLAAGELVVLTATDRPLAATAGQL